MNLQYFNIHKHSILIMPIHTKQSKKCNLQHKTPMLIVEVLQVFFFTISLQK